MKELKELDKELIKKLFPRLKKSIDDFIDYTALEYDTVSKHKAFYDQKNKIAIIDFFDDCNYTFGAYEDLEDGGYAIIVVNKYMDGKYRYFRDDKDGKNLVYVELNKNGEIIK